MTRKLIKSCLFIALSVMTFNAFAYCVDNCCNNVYVGNPARPYTVWVPGHCTRCGFVPGHYIRYICPPVTCCHVRWNRCAGRWVPYNVVVVGYSDSEL